MSGQAILSAEHIVKTLRAVDAALSETPLGSLQTSQLVGREFAAPPKTQSPLSACGFDVWPFRPYILPSDSFGFIDALRSR